MKINSLTTTPITSPYVSKFFTYVPEADLAPKLATGASRTVYNGFPRGFTKHRSSTNRRSSDEKSSNGILTFGSFKRDSQAILAGYQSKGKAQKSHANN
jgi:hypothetical protein